MYILALTTCPNMRTAKKIANTILDEKLAACVNIVPGLTSLYWWKGKKMEGTEILLMIKTTESNVRKLGKTIRENHPYELEEFITLPVGGSKKYFDWVDEETA
jgi:periplasmic divalent cation tolerance protein